MRRTVRPVGSLPSDCVESAFRPTPRYRRSEVEALGKEKADLRSRRNGEGRGRLKARGSVKVGSISRKRVHALRGASFRRGREILVHEWEEQ
jgi:hypothetical protein